MMTKVLTKSVKHCFGYLQSLFFLSVMILLSLMGFLDLIVRNQSSKSGNISAIQSLVASVHICIFSQILFLCLDMTVPFSFQPQPQAVRAFRV
jgi:hypothetical protein